MNRGSRRGRSDRSGRHVAVFEEHALLSQTELVAFRVVGQGDGKLQVFVHEAPEFLREWRRTQVVLEHKEGEVVLEHLVAARECDCVRRVRVEQHFVVVVVAMHGRARVENDRRRRSGRQSGRQSGVVGRRMEWRWWRGRWRRGVWK